MEFPHIWPFLTILLEDYNLEVTMFSIFLYLVLPNLRYVLGSPRRIQIVIEDKQFRRPATK
jgi:hypothetical protein